MTVTEKFLSNNPKNATSFSGPLPDVDADVRQSLARIQASPYIVHKDQVRGFVFDVASGELNEISPA